MFHVGKYPLREAVAMPSACVTRVEIVPLVSLLPLAVCEGNQVLWIADTGCGSNLVPESDVIRGVSQVVANRGVRRMMTANGEVEAPEGGEVLAPGAKLGRAACYYLAVYAAGADCWRTWR